MSRIGIIALLIGIAVATYFLDPANRIEDIGATLAPGNEVVMYSLTTCPYCVKMRRALKKSGIPFVEYFLDTDPARMAEFNALLAAHRLPPGSVGTPSFVVNGVFLPNNPGLEAIKRSLRFRPG